MENLKNDIVKEIKSQFKKANIQTSIKNVLGNGKEILIVDFSLVKKEREDLSNVLFHRFLLEKNKDQYSVNIVVDGRISNFVNKKDKSIKFNFLNKTSDHKKIVLHFKNYFEKIKKISLENIELIPEHLKEYLL